MCQWPPCMSSNSTCVCVHVYNCALPQHENVDINNMESLNFSLEYREYIFLHMHLEVVNPLLPKKPPHGSSHKDKPPQCHFTPPPPPPPTTTSPLLPVKGGHAGMGMWFFLGGQPFWLKDVEWVKESASGAIKQE